MTELKTDKVYRNYKLSTIKALFALSYNQCSHPECDVPVVAPEDGISDTKVISEIAHIFPISKNGPRASKNSSIDELNDLNNLLLLCPTHHTLVDKQPDSFPAELLHSWRLSHIRKRKNENTDKHFSGKSHFPAIPESFYVILKSDSQQLQLVESYLQNFSKWYPKNPMVFFREYTDHGCNRVEEILTNCSNLITKHDLLTPSDISTLICAVIVQDQVLRLSQADFVFLVSGKNKEEQCRKDRIFLDDVSFPELWRSYKAEVQRLSEKELIKQFRNHVAIPPPELTDGDWTDEQKQFVGNFIRKHHCRIAYEIALHGFPLSGLSEVSFSDDETERMAIALVVRSESMRLRAMIRHQSSFAYVEHPIFIMVILRIANWPLLNFHKAYPDEVHEPAMKNPIWNTSWKTHAAFKSIELNKTNFAEVITFNLRNGKVPLEEFLIIRELLLKFQEELDTCWAVLGEVYNIHDIKVTPTLTVRRVRSGIDEIISSGETESNLSKFGKDAGYVPERIEFISADSDLMKLMIKPLYGEDRAEVAVRELLQNALDACRERIKSTDSFNQGLSLDDMKVKISLKKDEEEYILSVLDTGIGMTTHTLKNYFLNVGASLRNSADWKNRNTNDSGNSEVLRSGRFGVGVLAAFLMAKEIENIRLNVKTQYSVPNKRETHLPLEFEAQLLGAPIEVYYANKSNYGTQVDVVTKESWAFDLLQHNYELWDWYCLDSPKVERYDLDGRLLPQRFSLPSSVKDSKPGYHWIDVPGFEGICWSYLKMPRLVCNGIRVVGVSTDNTVVPTLFMNNYFLGSKYIDFPNLSIFDPNANLQISLDRSQVSFNKPSFSKQLKEDVLNNIIAYLVVFAPEDIEINTNSLSWSSSISAEYHSFAWMFKGDEVALFDPDFMTRTKLTKDYDVIASNNSRSLKKFCTESKFEQALIILHDGKHLDAGQSQVKATSYKQIVINNTERTPAPFSGFQDSLSAIRRDSEIKGFEYLRLNRSNLMNAVEVYLHFIEEIGSVLRYEYSEKRIPVQVTNLVQNAISALPEFSHILEIDEGAISDLHTGLMQFCESLASSLNYPRISDDLKNFHDRFTAILASPIIHSIEGELHQDPSRLFCKIVDTQISYLPEIELHNSEDYKLADTIIDWENASIERDFLWIEEAQKFNTSDVWTSEISRHWFNFFPNVFIPKEYSSRKKVLKDVWERPDMIRHFEYWDTLRTCAIQREEERIEQEAKRKEQEIQKNERISNPR